ncbi:putative siderophore transport system ATP-binding protein YusV [Corynebacterium ciconiae DSM 44920]|uniref:ABC transporter ATP-binding protein n=1 Tax=Corynebacterium ciconiae TaxID=227319 RepID=UPI000366D18B|nr:ATP-binding cassette domain-containing protein [Corynebacterium ciconiae]WKD62143.1 putative siderophore transport system ATP-binding protein YusV [Corynebacterium ciconiae DSM 44920]
MNPSSSTPTQPTESSIRAEDLTVRYTRRGEAVIEGLNLTIGPGVTALIGPNGCGKSTLLRTLSRLIRPSGGAVWVDGHQLARLSKKSAARLVAVLGQHGATSSGMTVRDVVSKGRYPYQGLFQPQTHTDMRAVDEALEHCGITQFADHAVDALSGGQKQRAWIAMTLAQTTPIVFLDEPTSYLDIGAEQRVLELISAIAARGIRVIVVLHDVNSAAQVADTVVVMRRGQIIASGPCQEVLTSELHRSVFGLECHFLHARNRTALMPHLGAGVAAPREAAPPAALSAREIRTGYGDTTVSDGLSMEIPQGMITGVIGPNGCGKSTLVRTLTGIVAPQAGTVECATTAGVSTVHALSAQQRGRHIAVLAQHATALEGFSVEDVVSAGRHPHRRRLHSWSSEDEQAVEEALALADIVPLRHRPLGHLSGGQQQRVWLARALAQDTPVLVLDEPTTYLDRTHQVALMEAVAERNATTGVTVLMVLHDINLAARYCHHMIAMNDGQIVAKGRPSEVLTAERIAELYGAEVDIHHVDDSPVVVPVSSRAEERTTISELRA